MKLFGYWRSSSAYRVRIALNLKGLSVEHVPVHLVRDGGEQNKPAYRSINPQGRVPSLVLDDGTVLTQSSAIIEYLEEIFPEPALLPRDSIGAAQVRAAAAIFGADVHALHNVGPLNYLRREFGATEEQVGAWVGRWVSDGLAAFEHKIGEAGFCFGEEPGLADLYLAPQLYTARRFNVPLDAYPKLQRVDALLETHPAFVAAHPSRQPDAE